MIINFSWTTDCRVHASFNDINEIVITKLVQLQLTTIIPKTTEKATAASAAGESPGAEAATTATVAAAADEKDKIAAADDALNHPIMPAAHRPGGKDEEGGEQDEKGPDHSSHLHHIHVDSFHKTPPESAVPLAPQKGYPMGMFLPQVEADNKPQLQQDSLRHWSMSPAPTGKGPQKQLISDLFKGQKITARAA